MSFGWLNLSGGVIILLMLVPNIAYAATSPGAKNLCTNRLLNIGEQVGRYGAMLLMVLPIGARGGEFGFSSEENFFEWIGLCAFLLLAYYACWWCYFRKPGLKIAMALALIPSAIFVLRGVFLASWALAAAGVVFAVFHSAVTYINNKNSEK